MRRGYPSNWGGIRTWVSAGGVQADDHGRIPLRIRPIPHETTREGHSIGPRAFSFTPGWRCQDLIPGKKKAQRRNRRIHNHRFTGSLRGLRKRVSDSG